MNRDKGVDISNIWTNLVNNQISVKNQTNAFRINHNGQKKEDSSRDGPKKEDSSHYGQKKEDLSHNGQKKEDSSWHADRARSKNSLMIKAAQQSKQPI
ncbi:hypothetical protein M513_09362 [Trichuris suis]|uniref:Uncharacterized protein n=1 Tax=Trichuris suis TaxID=68888 RepID=A0A085LXS1_9BILA|nr:hypothetical protein M513_09362 [Trichuris suis]